VPEDLSNSFSRDCLENSRRPRKCASWAAKSSRSGLFRPLFAAPETPISEPIPIFQTVSSRSTLAIGLRGIAHLFAFLGCPWDFYRVGVGAQHAKSHRSLHGPKSPPLVRTASRRTGHGTKGRLSDPGNRALGVTDWPFRAAASSVAETG
jgi:hypothetical protein